MIGKCSSCKFFAQGKTCSYCENPVQTNEELKGYSYYFFGCNLYEKGISQSRLDFIKNNP